MEYALCNVLFFFFQDSGVQCSAELDALYEVYMEQSADFEQRENTASTEENTATSLNSIQKVKIYIFLCFTTQISDCISPERIASLNWVKVEYE